MSKEQIERAIDLIVLATLVIFIALSLVVMLLMRPRRLIELISNNKDSGEFEEVNK